ncbi:MAG: LapD/MoxY N-terminal periplasmic domain-containing protein, partial [Pseudomonadota bacterium]|nr:LapD/MoxY N-terminal periplasmic domain-containing protein [Pseudomonadota bacterium]
MTLTRQLWIAIIAIVLLNGSVSFWLLFTTTHRTFEEQLYLKNIDDANVLALLLTQSEKSQTNMELLIAAKFNAGNYASIRLIDMDGNMISEFSYTEEELDTVPQWFAGIVHFAIPPGVSQVSEGWGQYGTLYVENQTTYALELFWLKFRRFILSLTLVTVLVGMIGSMLLRSILKPLGKIVQQANSFSQRRFVTLDRPW